METKNVFTSESVTCGHPDKVCDQIADAILDSLIAHDPNALVGCEVTACRDNIHILGEITSVHAPEFESIARTTLRDIGYTLPALGFDADTCNITVDVHEQSTDISRSVERMAQDDAGAGDQGMVFGYACDETPQLMPLPITLAHALAHRIELIRKTHLVGHLLPDGKAQISVEYNDHTPTHVSAIVLSAQHEDSVDEDTIREVLANEVVHSIIPANLLDDDTLVYINPTGRFVVGGPAAKTGLSGRKTTADTYGGSARWGGSSLVGKDPTKINRSGAYLARFLAKNVVAAHLAKQCEVRLAYALGLADPLCVSVETFGTGTIDDGTIADWMIDKIDMRPAMIIERFKLRRPIYRALSCYGQFGTNAKDMPWEQVDLAPHLMTELG